MKFQVPSILISAVIITVFLLFLKFELRQDISYAQAVSPIFITVSSYFLFGFCIIVSRILKK
jgi:hypothetical protein